MLKYRGSILLLMFNHLNMKKFTRGFTLIELLVVIAIIGILSSIILVSLSTARSKAKDAKISGQLSGMRSAAEIYYGGTGNNSYGAATNSCTGGMFGASEMSALVSGTLSDAGGASYMNCVVAGSATASTLWMVEAKLSTGVACVDSTGKSYASTTLSAIQTVTGTTPNFTPVACR